MEKNHNGSDSPKELAHCAYSVQWGTLLEFYICFKFSQDRDLQFCLGVKSLHPHATPS